MSEPVALRIVRPYSTQEEFLAAESWTILDEKSMVLVDQDIAKDTIIRFELVLADGSRIMRGEAKVTRQVPETDDKPGGVRIRFRRFGASTKGLIDRVLSERKKSRRSRRPSPTQTLVLEEATPAAEPTPSAPNHPEVEPDSIVMNVEPEPQAPPVEASPPKAARAPGERPGPVEPPPNRDELLGRLRERAQRLRQAEE